MVKLNKKGETLLEALCALAILVLVVTAMATVITKSSQITKNIKDQRIAFNESNRTETTYTITIDGQAYTLNGEYSVEENNKNVTYNYNVNGYSDGELYYYEYEYNKK